MESFDYSANWKFLDTILLYKDPTFEFKSSICFVDFENCLVKKISTKKIYDGFVIDKKALVEPYDSAFIKRLKKEQSNIVVLSNQINANKLNIDIIMKKFEVFLANAKIPMLAIFALNYNCFSKPHTGMWKFITALYKKHMTTIREVTVISNEGGLIVEKEKNKTTIATVIGSDVDRCFAYNIGAEYMTIKDYLGDTGRYTKFIWNQHIIAPELRRLCVDKINSMENPNIFKILNDMSADTYVIMLMGAPCSGKTTFARRFVKKWQESKFSKTNEIRLLSSENLTKRSTFNKFKKFTGERIHVIIDDYCNTASDRVDYINHIRDANLNIGILFCEINVGIHMAKILNYARVEDANDFNVKLYKYRDFSIFASMYQRPSEKEYPGACSIIYYPKIDERPSIMNYRYTEIC